MHYDVFNGDADGICALHMLRLAEPRESTLVTGVKRDINLLRRIATVKNASITILDISMDKNKADLERLLETCRVFYADHHFSGEIPSSKNLEAYINTNSDICTSLIIDGIQGGEHRAWAVAAAFGDNLHAAAAAAAAASLSLNDEETAQLCELGELMNYNGYGKTVEDLHFKPEDLYKSVEPFKDPLEFFRRSDVLARLRDGYRKDMARARSAEPITVGKVGRVFRFPGEAWPRRIAGVFSNEMARQREDLAHALIVDNNDGTHLVSVRAPLQNKKGADELCRTFPTGGGRAAAAGINALPEDQMDEFIKSFREVFAQ